MVGFNLALTATNLMGIDIAGSASVVFSGIVLMPVVVLLLASLPNMAPSAWLAVTPQVCWCAKHCNPQGHAVWGVTPVEPSGKYTGCRSTWCGGSTSRYGTQTGSTPSAPSAAKFPTPSGFGPPLASAPPQPFVPEAHWCVCVCEFLQTFPLAILLAGFGVIVPYIVCIMAATGVNQGTLPDLQRRNRGSKPRL